MALERNLRAALYVRVSTTEQELKGQLREVRGYVRRRGWKEAALYEDLGASGMSSTRRRYMELLHDAAMNRFDVVVVWAIDRFGRNLVELLGALEDLERYQVKFASVVESHIDTTRPEGQLMLHLLASFAQFERARLSERTKVGIDEWRRGHGGQWGRPPSVQVDRVRELLQLGWSKNRIAAECKCSVRSVRRVELSVTPACNVAGPRTGKKGGPSRTPQDRSNGQIWPARGSRT